MEIVYLLHTKLRLINKVPGGVTLIVREKGVEVSGVTNWDNQKESQVAQDMAGALRCL